MAWHRLDKALSRIQFRRISTSIIEIYKLQQAPPDLVGAPLGVITYLLTFRTAGKKDKTVANSVENTSLCGQALLSRAKAT
eukprot:5540760-Pyramimonas_sp.AAC.1